MNLDKIKQLQNINVKKNAIKCDFNTEKIKATDILKKSSYETTRIYFQNNNFQIEFDGLELTATLEDLQIRFICMTEEQMPIRPCETIFFVEVKGPIFISYIIRVENVRKFPIAPDKYFLMDKVDVAIKLAEEEIKYYQQCLSDYKEFNYKYSYTIFSQNDNAKKTKSFNNLENLYKHLFK